MTPLVRSTEPWSLGVQGLPRTVQINGFSSRLTELLQDFFRMNFTTIIRLLYQWVTNETANTVEYGGGVLGLLCRGGFHVGLAMKTTIDEQIEGFLRYYKLMMRWASQRTDQAPNVFCINKTDFKNSTKPDESVKHIAYHCTREAQVTFKVRKAWEDVDALANIADLLTKLFPGPKLRELVSHVLW